MSTCNVLYVLVPLCTVNVKWAGRVTYSSPQHNADIQHSSLAMQEQYSKFCRHYKVLYEQYLPLGLRAFLGSSSNAQALADQHCGGCNTYLPP